VELVVRPLMVMRTSRAAVKDLWYPGLMAMVGPMPEPPPTDDSIVQPLASFATFTSPWNSDGRSCTIWGPASSPSCGGADESSEARRKRMVISADTMRSRVSGLKLKKNLKVKRQARWPLWSRTARDGEWLYSSPL
jgi:hypothetical protein